MNATATQTGHQLSRDNYKGHGTPKSFYYWGNAKDASAQGTEIASVEVNGLLLVLVGADGTEVASFDKRAKFWLETTDEVRHYSDGDSIATVVLVPAQVTREQAEDDALTAEDVEEHLSTVQVTVKAKRPSRNAKLSPCRCGCKAQVKGLYKQGHDARHAGDVARKAIAAGADADLSAILAELPTEALQAKAAKMVAKVLVK